MRLRVLRLSGFQRFKGSLLLFRYETFCILNGNGDQIRMELKNLCCTIACLLPELALQVSNFKARFVVHMLLVPGLCVGTAEVAAAQSWSRFGPQQFSFSA